MSALKAMKYTKVILRFQQSNQIRSINKEWAGLCLTYPRAPLHAWDVMCPWKPAAVSFSALWWWEGAPTAQKSPPAALVSSCELEQHVHDTIERSFCPSWFQAQRATLWSIPTKYFFLDRFEKWVFGFCDEKTPTVKWILFISICSGMEIYSTKIILMGITCNRYHKPQSA